MKSKGFINSLFQNDKFVLFFSLLVAIGIWVLVVINVSPQTTRVIEGVKVVIDDSVPSQFGLEVFGESEFLVDVTVKGKKYQISPTSLSAEDLVVRAVTNNVNTVGVHNLQLVCEPVSGYASFQVDNLSQTNVNVYFDTSKSVELVIEPEIITKGVSIVQSGFSSGDPKLSETSVTITGPSSQVSKIDRVVTKYTVKEPLGGNVSEETKVVPVDKKGNSNFEYLEMSVEKVILTIPVYKVKILEASVVFKNAPDSFLTNPLEYTVSPSEAEFNIPVEDYGETTSYPVGTIDFKSLYIGNDTFTFYADDNAVADKSIDVFEIKINLDDYDQDQLTVDKSKFKVSNPNQLEYTVSDLDKAIVIVGKPESLSKITEDMVTVEIDLSGLEIAKGTTIKVPAVVTIDSPDCWVCGSYEVEITL